MEFLEAIFCISLGIISCYLLIELIMIVPLGKQIEPEKPKKSDGFTLIDYFSFVPWR